MTKSFPTSTLAPEANTLIPDSVKTTLPDTGVYSNSKTTLSYAVFLDPLTINDGLMDSNEDTTITPSPNTYLPKTDPTELEENSITTTPSSIRTSRRGRLLSTTPSSIETLDSDEVTEPLQKRANFMFGNLNDTQADHLMNVMKKADKNKTVKRLILLLIQTCDDDYNKTVEESRTAILNALIGMDSKDNTNLSGGDFNDIQVSFKQTADLFIF